MFENLGDSDFEMEVCTTPELNASCDLLPNKSKTLYLNIYSKYGEKRGSF